MCLLHHFLHQAIEDSLCMSEEERRERHRQNYMHVQVRGVVPMCRDCQRFDCLLSFSCCKALHHSHQSAHAPCFHHSYNYHIAVLIVCCAIALHLCAADFAHPQTHTAQHWADTFISELNDTHTCTPCNSHHIA